MQTSNQSVENTIPTQRKPGSPGAFDSSMLSIIRSSLLEHPPPRFEGSHDFGTRAPWKQTTGVVRKPGTLATGMQGVERPSHTPNLAPQVFKGSSAGGCLSFGNSVRRASVISQCMRETGTAIVRQQIFPSKPLNNLSNGQCRADSTDPLWALRVPVASSPPAHPIHAAATGASTPPDQQDVFPAKNLLLCLASLTVNKACNNCLCRLITTQMH